MNSFATRDDTLEALERYPELRIEGLPLDFVQGKVPKLLADGFEPVSWPDDPALEWAPPGHGDVFTSLATSGMLDTLLERGYEYLFLSNSDNLGAALEPRILDWFAREQLPFLSEVVDRTEGDRKGGHLARRRGGGGLVLRETAQVPDEDQEAFEDVERHRFFNANNIWVNLRALKAALEERGGVLGLPMIVNRKTVDPNDPSSPEVLQLETAMGAAIGVFEGAARGARATGALRAGEDHEQPPRRALGRLRAGGRLDGPARAAARRRADRGARRTSSSCCAASRSASRPARPRWWRPSGWRSRATCASGRGGGPRPRSGRGPGLDPGRCGVEGELQR